MSRGSSVIVVTAVMTFLAFLSVVFRFVARHKTRVGMSVDDYFAIASLIWIIGGLVEMIILVAIGKAGHHLHELSPQQKKHFYKIFLSTEISYGVISPLVKVTILTFYWRLFPLKWFRALVNFFIALCIAWSIAAIVASGLECIPIRKFWSRDVPGHCVDYFKYFLGIQGINIFLDVSIWALPWLIIYKIHRPWREKLGLCVVFVLGALAIASSCLRMWAITLIKSNDISYTVQESSIWTVVEPCIGLICACLPIIWGLFAQKVRSRKSSDKSPTLPPHHSTRCDRSGSTTERCQPQPCLTDDSHLVTAGYGASASLEQQLQFDSDSTLGGSS